MYFSREEIKVIKLLEWLRTWKPESPYQQLFQFHKSAYLIILCNLSTCPIITGTSVFLLASMPKLTTHHIITIIRLIIRVLYIKIGRRNFIPRWFHRSRQWPELWKATRGGATCITEQLPANEVIYGYSKLLAWLC